MTRTLAVLPTYNEAGNILRLTRDLRSCVPAMDVFIVDDNSPDGTGALADEAARALERVAVLHRPAKLGLGSAHLTGMRRALEGGYDVVLTMDCDYTHPPQEVPRLLAALEERRADIAVGSRYIDSDAIDDWPLSRRIISRCAHLCTKHVLSLPGDATTAFRAYRVSALRRVPFEDVRGDGYSFIFELLHLCVRAGFKLVEVPVRAPVRQAGVSKISRIEIVRAVKTVVRLWAQRMS